MATNSPWPGQCPGGVASSCVGCLPQAAGPLDLDNVIPVWQVDQTPPDRGLQLRQLVALLQSGLVFADTDFIVNDSTVSLAGTITSAHTWTAEQTFGDVTVDGILNAGTVVFADVTVDSVTVNSGTVSLNNLPTSDAGLTAGRLFLNGNFVCVAGV